MKRSVQLTFVCAVAIALGLAISCSSSPPTKTQKPVKMVAFITNSTSDFWKIARKGTEKADTEMTDVAVAFKTTNTGAVDEQNGLVRHARAPCPESILCGPMPHPPQARRVHDQSSSVPVTGGR